MQFLWMYQQFKNISVLMWRSQMCGKIFHCFCVWSCRFLCVVNSGPPVYFFTLRFATFAYECNFRLKNTISILGIFFKPNTSCLKWKRGKIFQAFWNFVRSVWFNIRYFYFDLPLVSFGQRYSSFTGRIWIKIVRKKESSRRAFYKRSIVGNEVIAEFRSLKSL